MEDLPFVLSRGLLRCGSLLFLLELRQPVHIRLTQPAEPKHSASRREAVHSWGTFAGAPVAHEGDVLLQPRRVLWDVRVH